MPINPREFFSNFDNLTVRFTPQAQRLIFTIIESIYEDPHPKWKIQSHSELEPAARRIIDSLPQNLNDIAADPSSNAPITTFEVLHWLATTAPGQTKIRLDWLCPFEK